MGKPSAPPPPDYAALAQQQGIENRDTANFNTNLNRADQITPYGSMTWTMKPGADPQNPQPGDYIQTMTLSPEQQKLLDSQNAISQSYADTAQAGLSRVGEAMATPFNTSNLPALRTAGSYTAPNQQIDTSGLNDISGDYAQQRQAVQDAIMSRANTSLDANENAMRTRLINQGVEQGSDAWNREMQIAGQNRNDAIMQAILAGGQEQSRLAGLDLAKRGQLYSEAANNASFGNQAALQQFQAGLQGAGFDNQARQQAIQEQAYLRQLPINETNALRTGAQVTGPQFSSYYTGGSAQAAPVYQAGQDQAAYNMQKYQQQQSGYNAMLGGLASMGSAWLMPT